MAKWLDLQKADPKLSELLTRAAEWEALKAEDLTLEQSAVIRLKRALEEARSKSGPPIEEPCSVHCF